MRFLLDTNVLSEPARPEPNAEVMKRLERHRDDVCTAAPVWNELLYGYRLLPPSKRRKALRGYLRDRLEPTLIILPYDTPAADWHAEECARLGRAGKTPAFVDGQIAAVARVNDLVLVTGNVAHYQDFEGLVVEDWTRKTG